MRPVSGELYHRAGGPAHFGQAQDRPDHPGQGRNGRLGQLRQPEPGAARPAAGPQPLKPSRRSVLCGHEMVLEAIRGGDGEDAYFYMRENLEDFHDNCLSEYESPE